LDHAVEGYVPAAPVFECEESPMLAVTENATSVIQQLTDRPELPDGAGLRIATSTEAPDLTVSAAGAPEEGDQVVENGGARVFLESGAAAMLDDKVLDARVNDAGGVEFLVAAQS
jgi:iron-sulfur cluster assembly protein